MEIKWIEKNNKTKHSLVHRGGRGENDIIPREDLQGTKLKMLHEVAFKITRTHVILLNK